MSAPIVPGRLRAIGALTAVLAIALLGCNSSLNDKECDTLRSQAFDIVNEAHPCNSDEDCVGTEWPGCMKPVSAKNGERIHPLMTKFKEGKCEEPKRECRNEPEVYCKQGLCVVRERPPES